MLLQPKTIKHRAATWTCAQLCSMWRRPDPVCGLTWQAVRDRVRGTRHLWHQCSEWYLMRNGDAPVTLWEEAVGIVWDCCRPAAHVHRGWELRGPQLDVTQSPTGTERLKRTNDFFSVERDVGSEALFYWPLLCIKYSLQQRSSVIFTLCQERVFAPLYFLLKWG